MTRPSTPDRREEGFTLIEVLIVLVIIGILVTAAWVALQAAKEQSKIDAMKTAAATIDNGFGSFNRIYPPVGADPFGQLPTNMTANQRAGTPFPNATTKYLQDESMEPLIAEWPKNPYGTGGVRVTAYTSPVPCTQMGVPGEVRVCRMGGANGAQTYTVVGYAKDRSGATFRAYTASHGSRG